MNKRTEKSTGTNRSVAVTDSIRMKLIMIMFFIISGIFLIYFIVNALFLDKFYMNFKKKAVMEAYHKIEAAVAKDEIEISISESTQDSISELCETYGVAIVIVGMDNYIQYQYGNGNELRRRLTMIDFGFALEGTSLINRTDNYVFQSVEARGDNYGYLELYGSFQNNRIFLMRTTVESIQESAKLSRIFFLYVGIGILLVSVVIVYVISSRFTRPILELAQLFERMSNLDFSARYQGDANDEIGVLGNSMNILSNRLQETILELKSANNHLQKDIAQREEIDEMRKDFISNVSHELKTPISLIQGYAEGLKECIHDDAESRDFYCEVIMDESEKMNKLVRNLLMLNQLEFGNHAVQFEHFDIMLLIKGVLSSLDCMMKQNHINVECMNTESIYVYADEFQIEGVVTNYLTNAIHYAQEMENGGTTDGKKEKVIRIWADRGQDRIRVHVYNSGQPIPEEELDKIWIKFYKVDKARTRTYGGSGIGLSIVKAIMNAHGQECGVRNHDNGVEFWFELDTKLA